MGRSEHSITRALSICGRDFAACAAHENCASGFEFCCAATIIFLFCAPRRRVRHLAHDAAAAAAANMAEAAKIDCDF